MKNTIDGIKIRLNDTEEQISEWKKSSDNHWCWKEKEKKYEKKWEQFKRPPGQYLAHIHIIGVPEFSTSKQALEQIKYKNFQVKKSINGDKKMWDEKAHW